MTARPARKKSALSAGPAAVIAPPPVASAAPPARAAAPTPPPAAEMARLSIRIDKELLGQIRAAWWHTAATTGTRSMSAWVIAALEVQLRRSEVEHNGGQPFSPVDAGEIPRGPR